MAPGDEAPPGEASAGEDICADCDATGQVAGGLCANCGGTGIVQRAVGGG